MEKEDTPIVAYNTFYESWHEAMKELSNEEYGELARALNEYCFYAKEQNLRGTLKMLFTICKPLINASTRNKINGKNGGKMGKGGASTNNDNARKKKE